MLYWYMPSFKMDFLEEIQFAKEHFDFIEITPLMDLWVYSNDNYIRKIINLLDWIVVLWHIHWEIDLSGSSGDEIAKAKRQVDFLSLLWAKKITIHPSNSNIQETLLFRNNVSSLKEVNDYCLERGISLLVENTTSPLFNNIKGIMNLLDSVGNIWMTLDTWHLMLYSKEEINNIWEIKNRIEHVHLHDIHNNVDHIPFSDMQKMKKLIDILKKDWLTITLEIFKDIDNNWDWFYIDGINRREIILKQLEMIKSFY